MVLSVKFSGAVYKAPGLQGFRGLRFRVLGHSGLRV